MKFFYNCLYARDFSGGRKGQVSNSGQLNGTIQQLRHFIGSCPVQSLPCLADVFVFNFEITYAGFKFNAETQGAVRSQSATGLYAWHIGKICALWFI